MKPEEEDLLAITEEELHRRLMLLRRYGKL